MSETGGEKHETGLDYEPEDKNLKKRLEIATLRLELVFVLLVFALAALFTAALLGI